MKYKIRILFVIIAIFLISSTGVVAKQICNTEKSLALLEYTGVLDAKSESLERYVTRSEFCDYLFKAMKMGSVNDKRYFIDVPQEYWASGQINALTEYGVVSYAPDGMFNPEKEITYEQACKLIVYALGYEDYYIGESGMSAFIKIAKNIGINTKVESNSHITLEEAANLLFQAMSSTLSEKIMRNGNLYTVVNSDGDTLFGKNFDIYFGKGQLKSLNCRGIDIITEKGTAIIDEEKYDIYDNINIDSLFGEIIDFAYEDSNGGRNKIIYAASYYQDARLKIKSYSICDSSNASISFYKDENESSVKKVSFSSPTILFNGKAMTGSFTTAMSDFIMGDKIGTVELVKTNGLDYDLVIVNSYELIYATAYDSTLELIYGKERNIETGNYYELSIRTNLGAVTDIPKKFPVVIALAESEDTQAAEMIICNENKNIVISQYSDAEIISKDGEKYKIDKYAVDNSDFQVNVGNEYTVYFDINGNICRFLAGTNQGMQIGWIRETKVKRKEEIYFDIFVHNDNVTTRYKLAEKVRIDGKKYYSYEIRKVMLAFPGSVITDENGDPTGVSPQLIRFSVNENFEITDIDTTNLGANEDKNNSLREIDRGQRNRSGADGWYGHRILYSDSETVTKRMTVAGADCPDLVTSSESAKDEYYANTYTIRDGITPIIAYKWTDTTLFADLVVTPVDGENKDYKIYMFAGMTKMADDYGDVVDVAYAYGYGEKITFLIDSETSKTKFAGLNFGDLFTVTSGYNKSISDIKKIFDTATLKFEAYDTTYNDPNRYWYTGDPYAGTTGLGSWFDYSNYQAAKAYPVSAKGETMGVAYTMANASAKNMEMLIKQSGKSVMIYDTNKSKKEAISFGSFGSIKTFENTGSNCDIVIITSKRYTIGQIFVIRR